MEAYITASSILHGKSRGSRWGGHDRGRVVSRADGELRHMHIKICDKLFSKIRSMKLALALQAHFFGVALIAFRKRASSYTYLKNDTLHKYSRKKEMLYIPSYT